MNLVTGANGFVGSSVVVRLARDGLPVRRAVRTVSDKGGVAVGSIGPETEWAAALDGVDTVIHTAARAHMMSDLSPDPLGAFRVVNVEGTRRLANEAARAGVRRLIFISSIKVNGERTEPARPFRSSDTPAPAGPYARSKHEAEEALMEVAATTGLEVVVVRPPLVYGPGVRANFQRMLRWVQNGIPLPLGAVRNRRSMVGLENLVDLIIRCIDTPLAAGRIFLVSDGRDLSTCELIQLTARAMGRRARLISLPPALLRRGAALAGKGPDVSRLCDSLQVDSSETCRILGWHPPRSVEQGIEQTVDWFLDGARG